MLCGSLAALNGSQVSILPVARSSRWMPAKPLFCDQTLPSTCELCGLTMLTWAASMFCSFGIGQYVNFSVLRIELDDRGLVHVAEPQIAVAVGAQRQAKPVGKPGLCSGIGIFGDLAGLGIEPAEILLAEARVPGDAVLIDDDVMRRDRVARQVVFGIDHAGGAAARPRQRLEREVPLRLCAEIDAGPELRARRDRSARAGSPRSSISRSPRRSCGCCGMLWLT